MLKRHIFFQLICILVLLFVALPTFAQYVDTAWVRRYNGPGNQDDFGRAITVDASGNIYVTGYSTGIGTAYDYVTIMYYPNGDVAPGWPATYDGEAHSTDNVYAMAVDDSGYVYVTGTSYVRETDQDYVTIKYYPNGDTAWVRAYHHPLGHGDYAVDIAVDGSGYVYVTGGSSQDSLPPYYWPDYATIKYHPNGDTAWVRRYDGPGNTYDYAHAVAVDGSGNVYVTGYSMSTDTWPSTDYATIKYYPNGDTAWVRRYNGSGDDKDVATDIALDSSGNVYVTGSSYSPETNTDYATIKYYPNGDIAPGWPQTYNGPGNHEDAPNAIVVDGSGNVYVTGRSNGNGTHFDYATIKYDPNGNELWVRRYNGPEDTTDYARAIAVDALGNVYVTGAADGSESSLEGADYVTIKYDTDGNERWVERYNGPGDSTDYAKAIAVDGSGNVYVTGYSHGSATSCDWATIKYIQYDSIPFAPTVNYAAGDGPHSVFCADLDGDTDLDLALANIYSNDVSILKNNGNGTFQAKVDYGAGNFARSVFCAELDGDGDLDLAVANSESHNVSILKNEGDATFETKVDYATGDNPISVFCADLDGDLDIDLVVPNGGSDNLSIFNNNGEGTFQTRVDYAVGDWPHFVFCADLDGDADLDLAVANRGDDDVSILKNNGNGTFQASADYDVGDEPRGIFCADLDGDADLDLAVANSGSDDVSILKNNGDGSFQTKVDYDVGDRPYSVSCADLNGDTYLDLVTANSLSTSVSILENNGDGAFQIKVDYKVGSEPHTVFCADLDGDADLDMAVANISSDSVSVLKNLTQVPANQPPWAFSLISPTDQDTTFGSTAFRWQTPYDPNFGDQIRYDLHVSTDPSFDPGFTVVYDSLPLSGHTDTLGIDTYYWKVRAYDNWGAETWSTETWSFDVHPLSDTLWIVAYSPVDLIVTDPVGDSIGLEFNTILDATYDTTVDVNEDGDNDDEVTIPHPLVGEYLIRVIAEPNAEPEDSYSVGIRIDGSMEILMAENAPVPPPGGSDIISYGCLPYLRGDLDQDNETTLGDVLFLVSYLYKGGPAPDPIELGDVNRNDLVDLGDLLYLIAYLYKGGSPPCS